MGTQLLLCPNDTGEDMVHFSLNIAGVVYDIHANFPSTKAYCCQFVTDQTGSSRISVTNEDIAAERTSANALAIDKNGNSIIYSDAYLETLALLRKLAENAPGMDSFLIHGSAICVDGKAYLFSAPSGTGKSTHARLWREMLGDRAVMVNDDKPFILRSENVFYVCGSPWNGKHGLGNPIAAPLAAICMLHQAEENAISKLSAAQALPRLAPQCYMPKNPDSAIKTLGLIDALLKAVPVYKLGCNISSEAAELCFNTIK